jgi:hypothetical protein
MQHGIDKLLMTPGPAFLRSEATNEGRIRIFGLRSGYL